MSTIPNTVNPTDPSTVANREWMDGLCAQLQARVAKIAEGGGGRAREKHQRRGKLLVRERIELLIDAASPFWNCRSWRRIGCMTMKCRRAGWFAGLGG